MLEGEHLATYIVQTEQPSSMAEYPNFLKFIRTTHNPEFEKVPRTTCKSDNKNISR